MEAVLGIDVGGTSIKAGLFTPDGELLEDRKVPTPELVSPEAFATVTSAITQLLADHGAAPADVIACGLDVPGPVADDGTLGIIANVELDPKGFVAAFKAAFPQASIAFVNDANAAALGEMWAGSAKGATSCVVIAVGTGVGAGVVANGRLVAGAFDTFAPMLRERFDAYALKPSRAARIEVASLGNQAAMYGSAYEALRIRRESRTPSLD